MNKHRKGSSSSNGGRDTRPLIGFKADTKTNDSGAVSKDKFLAPCHKGFTEIHKGLFVGKMRDLNKSNLPNFDVLVPLADIDSDWYEDGFNGEIYAVPVRDYGVLPDRIAQIRAIKVADMVRGGKRVAIFCMGGHGRTGYFGSLVMYLLGYKTPVKYMRENYCDNVVESHKQIDAIRRICSKDAVAGIEPHSSHSYSFNRFDYKDYTSDAKSLNTGAFDAIAKLKSDYEAFAASLKKDPSCDICFNCEGGVCGYYGTEVRLEYNFADICAQYDEKPL